MATVPAKPSDSKMVFIKFSRALSYLIYGFSLVAAVFLTFGFFLLLFGANSSTPFVNFVYKIAAEFLQPFRAIFPLHQISETSYFSASALFAIIFYLFAAFLLNALIEYINLKMAQHAAELEALNAPEVTTTSTVRSAKTVNDEDLES